MHRTRRTKIFLRTSARGRDVLIRDASLVERDARADGGRDRGDGKHVLRRCDDATEATSLVFISGGAAVVVVLFLHTD